MYLVDFYIVLACETLGLDLRRRAAKLSQLGLHLRDEAIPDMRFSAFRVP